MSLVIAAVVLHYSNASSEREIIYPGAAARVPTFSTKSHHINSSDVVPLCLCTVRWSTENGNHA